MLGFRPRGGVPEWPKGSDCKSDGSAFGGSNPPPSTIILKSSLMAAFFVYMIYKEPCDTNDLINPISAMAI